jgi:hypothetical protein
MDTEDWPLLNAREERTGHVEVRARFSEQKAADEDWQNNKGKKYKNLYNALFWRRGAVKLFARDAEAFSQKWGDATFFACADKSRNDLFVMLDGETLYLLDRCEFDNRELSSISIGELKSACAKLNAMRRLAVEYRDWVDVRQACVNLS